MRYTVERAGDRPTAGMILLRLLLAFTSLLAMHVVYDIADGLETEYALIDLFSRVSNSFAPSGLSDGVLYCGLFVLISYTSDREKRPDIPTLILAVLLSLLYVISQTCFNMKSLAFIFGDIYQLCLALFCCTGHSIWIYPVLRFIFRLFEGSCPREEKAVAHPMRTAFLCILLSVLPWIVMNYPCSFNSDAPGQLGQWFGMTPWSAHHPPLSTAVMGLCVSLGERIADKNFGCFLYIVLQTVTGAAVFAFMLAEIYRMSGSRRLYTGLLLFFAATPFWGCYMQFFNKDLLYAELFALTCIYIVRVMESRSCEPLAALRIAAAALTAVLLRKTGTYELIPALVILALSLRGSSRIRLLSATAAVLAVSMLVNSCLYPALGIAPASEREALSIPFQQTARYVNTFPQEVTPEEREAIDGVLVYDRLDSYVPEISDAVKDNYRGDASKLPAYFRVWFDMLLKHPATYIEAFFVQCYGYLAPVLVQLDGYIRFDSSADLDALGICRVFGDMPTALFNCIRQCFIEFPAIQLLCTAGLYTWVLFICITLLLKNRRFFELIALIPPFMNLLICIASPLCGSTRYALPMISVTPLIIAVTCTAVHKRGIDRSQAPQ